MIILLSNMDVLLEQTQDSFFFVAVYFGGVHELYWAGQFT